MTTGRIRGMLAVQGGVWLLLLAILGLTAPAATAAEGERVFDPHLSLIGGCKEEAIDTVEDPGCPTTPPAGPHPPAIFANPKAVATDFYGNIFVSSHGKKEAGSEGRIDIFDSEGFFISELNVVSPSSLAIDSQGYLYVAAKVEGDMSILRFKPCAPYEPEAGNVRYSEEGEYCSPPFSVPEVGNPSYTGIAINQDNDHLFANFGTGGVVEHGSAEEGNLRIRRTEAAIWCCGAGMAVDAARDRMYASAGKAEERIDIFDLTSVVGMPPNDEYKKIGSIEESQVPAEDFGTQLSIAVDEATSHVFVLDGENCHLYEFDENDEYVTEIDEVSLDCTFAPEIGVDNGPFSPNQGYLYVPSGKTGVGHSFAFFESQVGKPDVISLDVVNITESEAELQSVINPHNLDTTYRFEIEAEGSGTWTLVKEGELPSGNLDVDVSAVAAGLSEGTNYRFRIVATNEAGTDQEEGSFATYPNTPLPVPASCTNALLRTGPSALLPDCRAYELVTPPDTNGHAPLGTLRTPGAFTNRQVSPAGDKTPFNIEGGSLPGFESYGAALAGEPYLASRTSSGWSTTYIGPTGAETTGGLPGSTSPDQGYSFWMAQVSGSAVIEGKETAYVRFPDGHSELLGQGSLGIDPQSLGQLISEGGDHIIFATGALDSPLTAVKLEPEAAPDDTSAIYDRIPNPETGVRETKVVSLKPGNEPFGAGEHAIYLGASLDGEGVGFEVDNTLYLRYDNEASFEIGTGVEFAGVAEGGRRIFYVEAGDLKAFDIEKGEVVFSETGDAVPVQVALGGSAAYFVSETAIAESGPNPEGDQPEAGKQNLYLSEEGEISFVGILTDRDVEGEFISGIGFLDGLGLWVDSIEQLGNVPARATPDGSALLFKARAALTDYDPEGHAQIYRYDSVAGELQCLSCNPTGQAPGSDATLQSKSREGKLLFEAVAWPENLRADGRRAFFQSSEPLVARDSDELQDVYEWEDQGVGSCTKPGGCIYLISSAQSIRNEYLWAVTPSGNDVFFVSYDLLVGADTDQTPSLYDARVGGGFPEAVQEICTGEGCRPQLSPPPVLPGIRTPVEGIGDEPRRCPKGKRKVKRHGKVVCVKKKKHRKAGTKQTGGRR